MNTTAITSASGSKFHYFKDVTNGYIRVHRLLHIYHQQIFGSSQILLRKSEQLNTKQGINSKLTIYKIGNF